MDNGMLPCPIHDLPPPWAVDQGPEVLYGESTMLLLGAPLETISEPNLRLGTAFGVMERNHQEEASHATEALPTQAAGHHLGSLR